MAQAMSFNVKEYCGTVCTELTLIKAKLHSHVRELQEMSGPKKNILRSHITHCRDIIDTIDWKLEYCATEPMREELVEREPGAGG